MSKFHWFALSMILAACSSDDDDATAKFVGSWGYAAGSTASVNCGGTPASVPFDTVVETFVETDGQLVKTDSQGCAGLKFAVSGDVASLASDGQSCTIPAAGGNPSATFSPSDYTFTISSDGKTLTQALTATYTPMGGSACTVTASNTLNKK